MEDLSPSQLNSRFYKATMQGYLAYAAASAPTLVKGRDVKAWRLCRLKEHTLGKEYSLHECAL